MPMAEPATAMSCLESYSFFDQANEGEIAMA